MSYDHWKTTNPEDELLGRPETKIEDHIAALLARKHEIDHMVEGQFIARQRWLSEAVELLLQIQLAKEA